MTIIHFVRHGHVYNPHNVFYGHIPGYRLSETGRQQAQAAAERLRDVPLAALYAGPLQRAQETAAIVAAPHRGLAVTTDDALNEVYTPYDGISHDELVARDFDLYAGTQPPYEQPADISRRAWDFMQRVCEAYPGGQVAAVTHGDVIAFMLQFALGMPVGQADKNQFSVYGLADDYPETASISTFTLATCAGDTPPTVTYVRPY